MPRIYLNIGSNIQREQNISSALRALESHFGSLTVSSIYESDAVGFEGDRFHNLAVGFDSELPVEQIAAILGDIEHQHGRTRDARKFSSRTLDVDLILYGNAILESGKLKLPRDEITRYAFVLEPLAEIAPQERYPLTGETYAELWEKFDKTGIKQWRVNQAHE